MQLTTEQSEAEAAKAAVTDAAAMDKLLGELEVPPPEQPPAETPPPEPKHEEKPPAETPLPPDEKPPAEVPPAQPAAVKPEPDEFEKEIESAKFDLPAGATVKAREVNKAIRTTAREEHSLRRAAETQRAELETRFKELEKQMTTAAQDRAELERLRPIVETFAIERDPRLNQQFSSAMAKIDRRIMTNLVNNGLEEETAKYIMAHGGPSHFSRDDNSQVDAAPERKGDPAISMSHKRFWEERVLNQLSEENQRPIKLAFDDETRVKEWRDSELRSKLSNREQYFKDLEDQSKKHEETFKSECKKQLDTQLKNLGDLVKEKTIPVDATPEQKERLENYNRVVQDATAKFDSEFLNTTPEALIRKNLGGLFLDNMKSLLAMKDAEVAEMRVQRDAIQKKWDASLKAASTSNRQSVQQQSRPLEGAQFEKNDGLRMEKMMENLPV